MRQIKFYNSKTGKIEVKWVKCKEDEPRKATKSTKSDDKQRKNVARSSKVSKGKS